MNSAQRQEFQNTHYQGKEYSLMTLEGINEGLRSRKKMARIQETRRKRMKQME